MERAISRADKKAYSPLRILSTYLLFTVALAASFDINAAEWTDRETLVFELVNQQRGINNLPPLVQNQALHDSALGHSQSMAANDFFSHTTLAGDNGSTFVERVSAVGHTNWTYGGENIAAGHGRTYDDPGPAVEMEPEDAARSVMYGTADRAQLNDFFFTDPQDNWSGWDEVGAGISGADWNAWHNHRRETTNDQRDGGWMGSEGHRENILSVLYDEIGVGYFWEPGDVATDLDPILTDEELDPITFPLHTYWTQDFTGDAVVAPVPLPGAFWLLGSALVGLFAFGRNRKEPG
jgi:uncharacterized protein YkwD